MQCVEITKICILNARNKISEISTEISVKFRLSVEIDKISPPIVDYTKFPPFFPPFVPWQQKSEKKNAFEGFQTRPKCMKVALSSHQANNFTYYI